MRTMTTVLFFLVLSSIPVPGRAASPYETSAQSAIQWIEANQNLDVSWGGHERVRQVYATEVCNALRSFYKWSPAYYRGIASIENHAFPNLDYTGQSQQSHYQGQTRQ